MQMDTGRAVGRNSQLFWRFWMNLKSKGKKKTRQNKQELSFKKATFILVQEKNPNQTIKKSQILKYKNKSER